MNALILADATATQAAQAAQAVAPGDIPPWLLWVLGSGGAGAAGLKWVLPVAKWVWSQRTVAHRRRRRYYALLEAYVELSTRLAVVSGTLNESWSCDVEPVTPPRLTYWPPYAADYWGDQCDALRLRYRQRVVQHDNAHGGLDASWVPPTITDDDEEGE